MKIGPPGSAKALTVFGSASTWKLNLYGLLAAKLSRDELLRRAAATSARAFSFCDSPPICAAICGALL